MAEFLVLGAGMVGVSTALALQSQGHAVTLIDRRDPGRETSFGNAGFIQVEAAEPYALPHDLRTLLGYVSGRSNDVVWSPTAVLRQAGALLGYYVTSGRRRHRALSVHYAALTLRAAEDHAPLIAASGSANLIARDGYHVVYHSPRRFEAAAKDFERITSSYGRLGRVLDGNAYLAEEPALLRPPAGAVHWQQSWTCADPGGLTAAYATLFEARGGRIMAGDALTLAQEGSGWHVTTTEGPVSAAQVVVALGPWSPELLKRFGYHIPMVFKRGYHGHFEAPAQPRTPVMDNAYGVVLSPMRAGLRVATGAALVDLNAPQDPRQLERGVEGARRLFAIGARKPETQWHGTRPCMPDMLPVVGAAPRHPGMWFHFGHGHQGFTLGPTTSALLLEAIEHRTSPLLEAISPAARRY
ncbi:FAD-binding oxidoreductase [Pseudooceanicola sp. CBS1P-1]|uniref:FAD-dependent oxidoreductase n=1 Tax=Pseudooceanicola albus TaxID=2692189 RepID=A0A6L7G254_9RHOB|nr:MULTISPECIES: FAD-dependent oxidoreductase [Pseudooceanicola]MBT9383666.1 FAD-binding oxidoreductase [Pseudooceanicola endophyticus]MXN17520.1 FAD-dependent oxidoreductase [Pseudooceanicola albus]